MFLACLILAKKYVTDYPIKNQAWVSVDGNFLSLQEINLIERQMLQLLEYKTLVTAKELQLVIPISSGCPIRAKSALGQAAKPTNIIVRCQARASCLPNSTRNISGFCLFACFDVTTFSPSNTRHFFTL
ncbi:hypothetical protein BDR26DRAFT_865546, partial [Obelidium mucronatum]